LEKQFGKKNKDQEAGFIDKSSQNSISKKEKPQPE
jgi:hypothetical protein